MTEAEVEAILGVPAGSYDWARPQIDFIWLVSLAEGRHFFNIRAEPDRRTVQNELDLASVNSVLVHETKHWISRHGSFSVLLDERGRVVSNSTAVQRALSFPGRLGGGS